MVEFDLVPIPRVQTQEESNGYTSIKPFVFIDSCFMISSHVDLNRTRVSR